MSGLAAKVVAVAVNNSASVTKIVRFIFTVRFERFPRETSIQTGETSAVLIDIRAPMVQRSGTGAKYETDSIFHLHWKSRLRANRWLTGPCPTAPRRGQEGMHGLRVFRPGQKGYVPKGKGLYLPLREAIAHYWFTLVPVALCA